MLRKRLMTLALAVVMTVSVFTGCGSKDDSKTAANQTTNQPRQNSRSLMRKKRKQQKRKRQKLRLKMEPIQQSLKRTVPCFM